MKAPGSPSRRGLVLSIRWVATATAVGVTVAAVLAVGGHSERAARTALRREIEARLQLQSESLAAASADALLGDFPELTLHPLVKDMRRRQPELAIVDVVDHRNLVQGDADPTKLGLPFTPPAGVASPPATDPEARRETMTVANGMLVARAPVIHRNGQVLGSTYVGLPLAYIEHAVRAARKGQALLLALFGAAGALLAFLLLSWLLRPIGALRRGLERIGRGDLDSEIAVTGRTELTLLADTVNDMARALKRAQAEMLERERLGHEIELAREIQRSLLPAKPVTAGAFDVRGDHRAAAEVGGDYWDVFPLANGRLGVAIADVSGKGLAGCMVMSMLSTLLRTLRAMHESPAALLAALDERLSESLRPGVFVTITYGVLDPAAGRLVFASAGHNPLIVWRRRTGATEVLASKGIPVGAVRGGAIRATLRDEVLEFEPGDVCVQFTDGYSEAFQGGAADAEQFGLDRLRSAVAVQAAAGAPAVLAAVGGAVREWTAGSPAMDDETLLVLACRADAPPFVRSVREEPLEAARERVALARLAEAERAGHGIEVAADLGDLPRLAKWIEGLPGFERLETSRRELATQVLYELVANVVEHGCGEGHRGRVAAWWLPQPGVTDEPGRGTFVVRDDGRPFLPGERTPADFSDPAVRARGRGLGLEIIHRAAAGVRYAPATSRGNITEVDLPGPVRERNAA